MHTYLVPSRLAGIPYAKEETMSLMKYLVALAVALSLAAPAAYAEEGRRADGTAVHVNPPCPNKLPKAPRGTTFEPAFVMRDGIEVCVWSVKSYQKPATPVWGWSALCVEYPNGSRDCPTTYGGYPYSTYGYNYRAGGREYTTQYSCRDQYDPNCRRTPAPADPRTYRR